MMNTTTTTTKGEGHTGRFESCPSTMHVEVACTDSKEKTVNKLRFYRIEAGVIDYDLPVAKVQEVLEKHFGFVMQTTVQEVNPFKPKQADVSPAKRRTNIKRGKNIRANTQARIDVIKKALGNKSMTMAELQEATGIDSNALTHALIVAEEHRLISVTMRPNKGTRALRVFKNV